MSKNLLLLVSFVFAVSLTGGVWADEDIIVPDAGFDDQVLPAAGYTYIGDGDYADSLDYPGPWQSAGGDAWIDNGYYVADTDLPAVSGDNKLYGYENTEDSVYQILDDTWIEGATYTLSCYEGSAWDDYDDGWWLYFTGEDYNQNLAEASGNGPVGDWQQVSLVYTATAADGGKKIGIKFRGDAWVTFDSFTLSYNIPFIANRPSPAYEQTDVSRDSDLSWSSGTSAVQHNVYVGESFEDVDTATVPTASGLNVTSFDPGRFEFGKTVFWRVDEVEGAAGNVHKGSVWSFQVEPYSVKIPAEAITITASSASVNQGPDKMIDESGLDGNAHSNNPEDMWMSTSGDPSPWLMVEFDSVQELDQMVIWNSNHSSETAIGWGLKDANNVCSTDGVEWTALAESIQLSQGSGLPASNEPQAVDLGLAQAKYVKINILSNWGGIVQQYGVAEVQFYSLPMVARTPVPESGATDVAPDSVASWRAGREASQHTVYLSTEMDAVADGTAPSMSLSTNSLDLASVGLELGQTYYWRVDEVNDAEVPSVWAGPVWSASTPAALAVDDFESYTNESPDRPFQTWIDGVGFTNPIPGNPGNGTGAAVGHDIWSVASPHFGGTIMERDITLPGSSQSMPLYYDNTSGVASQTDRTWAAPQDWSGHGIQTLVLHFYGSEDNTGGPLFVTMNGQKVTYPDNENLNVPQWHQWNIDLASVGINLNAVTSMSIGVEGAGSGMILIDDILLYRNAPEIVSGLSTYSFNDLSDDAEDMTGIHGGIDFGTDSWSGGDNWYGMAKCGYFYDDYVNVDVSFTLPANATLVSIAVSAEGAYSYTISDGVNADIIGTSGTAPEVINTNWTSGGSTITFNTAGGWNVTFDDITYKTSE